MLKGSLNKPIKLRHQGFVLIALPLAFELIFVALLTHVLLDVETAAGKESHAKAILALTGELQQTVTAYYLSLAATGLGGREPFQQQVRSLQESVSEKCKKLYGLVQDDPTTTRSVQELQISQQKLSELMLQLEQSFDKSEGKTYFWQFLHEKEFWEQARYELQQSQAQIQSILNQYRSTFESLQPNAARSREKLRWTIFGGVGLNIILAALLSGYLAVNTGRRLNILLENVERFRKGANLLAPLAGKDELATLDDSFREMTTARLRAEQLQRDLIAMVSHDLRSPLTAIRGSMSLLLDNTYGELNERQAKAVARAESDLARLFRMSSNLLDIEKIESGNLLLDKAKHQCLLLCESAVEAIRGLAEVKSIELVIDSSDELTVVCDFDRTVQVLINLLANAIKFSPRSTTIRFTVSREADGTMFAITDEGPGIAAESQAKIFNRFEQIVQSEETKREGSGLGLAICKSLVEQHGGTIGVRSALGKGSTFWFVLPDKS